jgi:hypothetical protein
MKKLKCIPGTLKLDISPCPDELKYSLTPELVRLQPYPGKYFVVVSKRRLQEESTTLKIECR